MSTNKVLPRHAATDIAICGGILSKILVRKDEYSFDVIDAYVDVLPTVELALKLAGNLYRITEYTGADNEISVSLPQSVRTKEFNEEVVIRIVYFKTSGFRLSGTSRKADILERAANTLAGIIGLTVLTRCNRRGDSYRVVRHKC